MINFYYETDFELKNSEDIKNWIRTTAEQEKCQVIEMNYVFCDDVYLHKLNVEYLDHDTYTDIITFDYSERKNLHGEIYISVDRVEDNAEKYNVAFQQELARVIIHGILHCCGYRDKSNEEKELMRTKEDFYLSQL